MKVLVTGSSGFIGKNLVVKLRELYKDIEIYQYDLENTIEDLKNAVTEANYIFHLAGINRPKIKEDFYKGNTNLTKLLIEFVELTKRDIPVVVSSSIHAELDNDYGKSKKQAETHLLEYAKRTNNKLNLYRLPNVFGKWSKPNYNSVVATFAHNIANDLPIQINDKSYKLTLVYIDDVVNEFVRVIDETENRVDDFCEVSVTHNITLGDLADKFYSFKESRVSKMTPHVGHELTKKLYSTYLSYLPKDQFSYDLKMNTDYRGSFTEFLKTKEFGQISVNVSKPGITKGNHWHHTKNEKFLVVSGNGVIRFRNILTEEIFEYYVNAKKMQVVDIPVGYTHNIENLGDNDMVTIMWANELFDPENPDTIYEEV